jgi:hypothetical protein
MLKELTLQEQRTINGGGDPMYAFGHTLGAGLRRAYFAFCDAVSEGINGITRGLTS